jgi:3-dehydroquinate dehydratase / shikimate dehydrogenase
MGKFGIGVDRICGVVAAATAGEMTVQIRAALRETPTVELRLDWLRSDAERARLLRWVRKTNPNRAVFLATCRRKAGGGKFSGDVEAELHWLSQARDAGCEWCDLEIETLRELPPGVLRELDLPPQVLLSAHDFQRMPPLKRVLSLLSREKADAIKVAANARTIADSVRLLKTARRTRDFVAVPMGEVALPARILALREGSSLAYAPVATATAPGQVALSDFKHLFRAHQLTRRSQVYGVIGDPIGHSLSPLLHNTGFAARKVDAVYLPFHVHDLRDFLRAIPELGIRGFSVTLPHKQSILPYLARCEPLAAEIGAVNTVVVKRNGSLYGCNTDYVGVLRALQKKLRIEGSRVLLFGAGGSARATAFALVRAGAVVGVCARRENAARELARAVGGEVVPRRALRTEFFDAVIHATPVGMHPRAAISPLSSRELHCRLVMDLIYRPQRTQLLKLAAQKGIAAVSGVDMFLAQGIAQWEIWTGQRAPEAAMRTAVLGALRREEELRSRG